MSGSSRVDRAARDAFRADSQSARRFCDPRPGRPQRDIRPRLRTRNAIPTRGSPDHPGSGARPGARGNGCRLQFQFFVDLVSSVLRLPRPRPPSSAACGPPTGHAAAAQITANWEKFFDASTPTSQRVALLQNGSGFSSAITAFSKLPLASGIGAKVTAVTVTSATEAAVTYNIVSGSTTLLSGQTARRCTRTGPGRSATPACAACSS